MIWSASAFGEIAALLARSSGLAFPPSRRGYAEIGMQRAMVAAREHDAQAFLRRVEREPSLLARVIAEVTVGETYFFRDPAQFAAIAEQVVPERLGRYDGTPLRMWSAGCSSGEEAYSLAILAEECGCSELVRILGTDISPAAIEAAERGRYGARSFRDEMDARRERCFTAAGKARSIDGRFRRHVSFRVHNLGGPDPALDDRSFDLILCRNVLIYFDEAAAALALRRLAERLAPGGWLFTSPTDPSIPEDAGLVVWRTPGGVAYRRPLPAPEPARARPRVERPAAPPSRAPAALPASDDRAALEQHVLDALRLLDAGQPAEALVAARRARYLDRTSPVANLALGRALRLCGRPDAARRALRSSRRLLGTHTGEETVSGTGGVPVATLVAVLEAELALLARAENAP